MGIEQAFKDVPQLQPTAWGPPPLVRLALQDDTYAFGSAQTLAEAWEPLKQAYASAGHRLRDNKCMAWSPLVDDIEDDALPSATKHLLQLIPRSRGGLIMLGGAAQGEMVTHVGSASDKATEKARARAADAIKLADRVLQFAKAQPSTTCTHQSWFVLAKSVAFSLSYDARLVPSQVLDEIAEPVRNKLLQAGAELIGVPASRSTYARMTLPGRFGGLSLRFTHGLYADACFWANWVVMRLAVPRLANRLGFDFAHCAGEQDALAARGRLKEAGVELHNLGDVSFTDACKTIYNDGPWARDTDADSLSTVPLTPRSSQPSPPLGSEPSGTPRRVASRICRHLDALSATLLWKDAPAWQQEAMLSAGGNGNGTVWTQLPDQRGYFPNGHFRMASQRRMCLFKAPAGKTC